MAVPDVVTLGETLVSFRGRLGAGAPLTAHVAGAESNLAIGLARLGHPVRWASRLGEDPFGDLVLRELRAEGVDARVERDPARATAVMFALDQPGGRLGVQYRRADSAASALGPELAQEAMGDGARALHLTGITPALSASAKDACHTAVEAARACGARVVFDINFRSRLWDRDEAGAVLAEFAHRADVVVGGADEFALIDPDADDLTTCAHTLLDRGVSEVVVKRGAAGATAFTGSRRTDARPVAVREVDPIGAGDAFCAGYLSGWLDGLDLAGCLGRGNALGAAAVSSRGDWEGLPTRAQLADLTGDDVAR